MGPPGYTNQPAEPTRQARRANSTSWRPSVLGLGLAGGLAEGGLEPLRVAGLPRAVGAHPLEDAVDEADHVDVVGRYADAVRLLGERLLVEDDGVRVLGCQAREHRVV